MSEQRTADQRVICWFSCGAASAVAAHMCPEAEIVYCNTLAEEHPDNARFLMDVREWCGRPIKIIRSEKYTSVSDVFMRERYMAGIKGARCTVEMKKIPRFEYQRHDDIHVFGMTADEEKRVDKFQHNNPELNVRWVLRDAGITKDDCYAILLAAGIKLPAMYELGFKNNNCIGCVKATSIAYWSKVRRHFPEVFARRAAQSRELGVRLTRLHGKRIFLDGIPPDVPEQDDTESVECGVLCGVNEETA